MKIEAAEDQSEIEAVEFAEESDPENMDETGPSTSVACSNNPGTSSKLLNLTVILARSVVCPSTFS